MRLSGLTPIGDCDVWGLVDVGGTEHGERRRMDWLHAITHLYSTKSVAQHMHEIR